MLKLFSRFLILAFCCGAVTGMATKPLRVATEGDYPPFSFLDTRGRLTGFDVDIAQALCRRLDKPCEIVATPWKNLLPGLAAGQYDMIVASMSKTPSREQQAEFTDAYYRARDVFIGHVGAVPVTATSAQGKVLATQADTIYATYLHQHYQNIATLQFTPTLTDAFKALVKGEADFVLCDNLSAFTFMGTDAGQGIDIIGNPVTINASTETAHIQVHKGNLALRDALNAALRDLRLDGTFHKINARYFPFDIYY